MKNKTIKSWISIILLIISLLSACTTGQVIGRGSKESVKIGAVLPLTGPGALSGEYYIRSAELAVKDINLEGGINGKQLELVVEDGKTDSKESLTAALNLFNVKGVNVLFTGFRGPSLAIASLTNQSKKIVVASTASMATKETIDSEYFFPAGQEVYLIIHSLAQEAKENNCKSIDYIHENTDLGAKTAEEVRKIFKENAFDEITNLGETDFRTLLSKIKAKEIDCLLVQIQSMPALNLLQQMEELGMQMPIYANSYAINPAVIQQAPQNQLKNLLYMTEGFYKDKSQKSRKFYSEYKEAFNQEPEPFGAIMYDLIRMTSQAMKVCDKQTRADDPECLKDEIPKMSGYTGLVEKYVFLPTNDIPMTSFVLLRVNGRESEFVKLIENKI